MGGSEPPGAKWPTARTTWAPEPAVFRFRPSGALGVCVVFPAISALEAGHEVYVVTDASGSTTDAAQEAAMQRRRADRSGARHVDAARP